MAGTVDPKFRSKAFAIGLAIFAFCLFVNLLYNLKVAEPGRLHIFDSSHYIQAGLFLTIAIEHALGAPATAPANLGQMLLLDGFGMPFCAAIAALISANKMTSLSLILVQSTVLALTASSIYFCALKMRLGLAWSSTVGLLWSLYPAAIVSAGTFLSEPLSGLLVSALTLTSLLCHEEQRPRNWCAFGLASGAIMVTKPALLIFLILVFVIMAASLIPQISHLKRASKQIIHNAASLALGTVLAILPWMVVTAAFAGHAEIMPSRLPSTNMALGCDYEVGFWETMPVPPLTLHNYARNPIRVFYELASEHTLEMPAILSKKFARLYFAPFNDFHDSVFGLSYPAQRLVHTLILALAFAGLLTIFATKPIDEKFGLALIAANLATHCCYMAFESLPRYAFSAVPLLFIAAVCMVRTIAESRSRSIIASGLAAIALAICCANIQFDDVQSKAYVLNQGEQVRREITPLGDNVKPTWIALVSDSELNSQNCQIKFNNREITPNQISLSNYPSGFLHQEKIDDIQGLLSRVHGVQFEKLAHYSMIALPIELLKRDGTNTIEITAITPLTIFGQKLLIDKGFRVIPALRYFSVTKMAASEDGLDGRVPDHRLVNASKSVSTIKANQLPSDQDLRLFLLLSPQENPIIDAQAGHMGSALRLW